MTTHDINLLEGSGYEITLTVLTADSVPATAAEHEVYGALEQCGARTPFSVSPTGEAGQWLVTIPPVQISGGMALAYQLFVRRRATGHEWLVLSGTVRLRHRYASAGDVLATPPLHASATLSADSAALTVTELHGVRGERGFSTYDIACRQGFAGTEAEWLASLKAEYAAEAVAAVTPFATAAETAAETATTAQKSALASADDAAAAAMTASQHMSAAETAAKTATSAATTAEAAAAAASSSAEQAHEEFTAAAREASAASEFARVALEVKTEAVNAAATAAQAATAATDAQSAAEAAQTEAEAQALAAATSAAEAQSPASIAAQAARVYTMLLLKDELQEMLGAGAFDVDTDGAKIIVHTDRLADAQLAEVEDMVARFVPGFIEVERYNHHIEISWRDIDKYAQCVTFADVQAVNANYKKDLTPDGEWIYPLTNLEDANQLFNGAKIKKWGIKTVPKVKNMFRMFYGEGLTGDEFECDFPSCSNTHDLFAFTRCRVFRVSFGQYGALAQTWYGSGFVEEVYGDFSKITNATLAFYKCLKLRVIEADWSSLSKGDRMFELCELPKAIVLRVLNTIPAYTSGSHPLTIGIHVDHQSDEEVVEAIAAAEEKGWTVVVQWNGTATAAAASTFARRQPVFARLGETLVDGTPALDWGHYVTNAEENGYTEFASLEEAKEHFNIKDDEQ